MYAFTSNNYYLLYKISWYRNFVMYAIFISFMIIWLWVTFLVVVCCIKRSMNNYQTSVKLHLTHSPFLLLDSIYTGFSYLRPLSQFFNHYLSLHQKRQTQRFVQWSVKLGLGMYQVIWYLQKAFVRVVNHVLTVVTSSYERSIVQYSVMMNQTNK